MQTDLDRKLMRHALVLARRGLGQVAPNPAVGCVIAAGKRIVGTGWTQPGGRPHGEAMALVEAGDEATGATAYVTLEPCSHTGETQPCAEALIKAGISRVVYAVSDPDPRVNGSGHAKLAGAGIKVESGVERAAAERLNAGFILTKTKDRPLFTLKVAQTLDARTATAAGESQWITGAEARRTGHMMRARHDAIMIGITTALADNPDLTCRLPGLAGRSPVRIVLDSQLRLPLESKLVQTAGEVPLWLIAGSDADGQRVGALEEAGARVITIPPVRDLTSVATLLAGKGITRVLVEGGATLHASFMAADLVDRLSVFTAPSVMGGDGLTSIAAFGTKKLEQSVQFRHTHSQKCGSDHLDCYERIM